MFFLPLATEMYFKAKALDHISYMDKNHDEEVDWEEFQAFMLPHVKAAIAAQGTATAEDGEEATVDQDMIQEHMKKFKVRELYGEN